MLAILLAASESEADKQKFTDIYTQYHPQMEQTAPRILKNRYDAEDAVQIIRHFEKTDEIPREKLPFWIVCIVKNEAAAILRKNQWTVQLENWDSIAADAESVTDYVINDDGVYELSTGVDPLSKNLTATYDETGYVSNTTLTDVYNSDYF